MAQVSRFRVRQLEARLRPQGPPVGQLLFLFPELWPEADRAAYHAARSQEALAELIERRTGIYPTFAMQPVWSISVPVPNEFLALSDAEKAAFLERHETRPLRSDAWEG